MNDNSLLAILVVCVFTFLTIILVFAPHAEGERELTKQMDLQWKMDSVASLQALPID